MVKLRLMGTQDDLNWFAKVLCNIKGIKVIRMSEKYLNKGTNRFFRQYFEIEREE